MIVEVATCKNCTETIWRPHRPPPWQDLPNPWGHGPLPVRSSPDGYSCEIPRPECVFTATPALDVELTDIP